MSVISLFLFFPLVTLYHDVQFRIHHSRLDDGNGYIMHWNQWASRDYSNKSKAWVEVKISALHFYVQRVKYLHSSVLFLDLTNVSKMRSIILLLLAQQLSLLVYLQHVPTSEAFGITNRFATQSRTTTSSSFLGQQFRLAQRNNVKANSRCNNAKGSTKLGMFLGSDGGLLGVGTPELVSITVWYSILNKFVKYCRRQ